jgi:general secretion pathway protein D
MIGLCLVGTIVPARESTGPIQGPVLPGLAQSPAIDLASLEVPEKSPAEFTAPLDSSAVEPADLESAPREQLQPLEYLSPQEKIDNEKTGVDKKREPYIEIKQSEKLADLVHRIAAKKGINIVLPHGAELIKETVNFERRQRIPLARAEAYLYMLLQMAGYSMYPKNGFYVVTKLQENNEMREPLPLYVDVPPDKLPATNERIRAIYYLSNLRVPDAAAGDNPIVSILKDMLGTGGRGYLFDQKSNAMILIAPARNIASVMHIIQRLDETGSPDILQIIPLFNASAGLIAKLLNEQILSMQTPAYGYRAPVRSYEFFYFTPNTKVVADTRTNSLVVIGQEMAVNRIKEFVQEYLDQTPGAGRSILHVYNLQYLDAVAFSSVLQSVVGTGGAQSEKEKSGGPQRFFDGVKVVAETKTEIAPPTASAAAALAPSKVTIGGNRLIVAADNDDWQQVKTLIEQLDKPEPQVIIEVMVVDLTVTTGKKLGAQQRNPSAMDLHQGVDYQSAQFTPPLGDTSDSTVKTIASDLLRLVSGSSMAFSPLTNGVGDAGSMVISMTDPRTIFYSGDTEKTDSGIWAVLRLLDRWTEQKILSHPFLVVKNNVTGVERRKETRRGEGKLVNPNAVASNVAFENYDADLEVLVTPRIISLDRLSMKVTVTVNNFTDPSADNFNRIIRSVDTNAVMNSGDILVVGGLTREINTESESEWPFLGKIPILQWFFKNRSQVKERSNLVVFIHPTVVDPKLRAGMNRFTGDKVNLSKGVLNEARMFDSLKDPITRWFFRGDDQKVDANIDEFFCKAYAKTKPDDDDQLVVTQYHKAALQKMKDKLKKTSNPFKDTTKAEKPTKKVPAAA